MTELLVPLLLLFVSLYGLFRRQDVYACLLQGAREGLSTLLSIVPSLIILLTAISMLRASGFFDLSARFLSPLFRALGMPPELAPLMLVRPVSGGAALAVENLRSGLPHREKRRCDVREHRDDVLYHQRLLWSLRRTRHPAHGFCRTAGRLHRFFHGLPHNKALFVLNSLFRTVLFLLYLVY